MSGQPLRAAGYSPDSILDCQVFKNLEALKREIGLEDSMSSLAFNSSIWKLIMIFCR